MKAFATIIVRRSSLDPAFAKDGDREGHPLPLSGLSQPPHPPPPVCSSGVTADRRSTECQAEIEMSFVDDPLEAGFDHIGCWTSTFLARKGFCPGIAGTESEMKLLHTSRNVILTKAHETSKTQHQ